MSKITSIGRILSSRNQVTKLRKVSHKPSKFASKRTYTLEQVEKLANELLANNPMMRISEAFINAEMNLVKRLAVR